MVKLQNTTGRALDFNLSHDTYCQQGPCSCQTVHQPSVALDARHGTRAMRTLRRRLCASVTVLAGEYRELPDGIMRVPEVRAAVQRGDLRII